MDNQILNKNAFISLTQALDSLRDVALAEFSLIESDNKKNPDKTAKETQQFVDSILKKVEAALAEIAADRQAAWKRLSPGRIKDFEVHIADLREKKSAPCPPGFERRGRLCVRT